VTTKDAGNSMPFVCFIVSPLAKKRKANTGKRVTVIIRIET
jgi:hypothetical protein